MKHVHLKDVKVKYSKSVLILLCGLLVNISCSNRNDIYEKIPLGSKLSKKILSESSQILPSLNGLILLYNSSDDWEYVNNHLLFFDKEMKLYAACFLPSIKIDSINGNMLYATLDEVKKERENRFRRDLPLNYRVFYSPRAEGSSGRKSDKLVNNVSLLWDQEPKILLDVMRSLDQYQGLGPANDTSYAAYTIQDTLRLDIDQLTIEYDLKHISISTLDLRGDPITDILVVRDYRTLNDFYDAILRRLYP